MTCIASFHTWVCRTAVCVAVALVLAAPAPAQERRYIAGFAGAMTEGPWEEAFDPRALNGAGSGLLGFAAGWEHALGRSRFSLGAEIQIVGHFGRQDHLEVALPATLRYTPRRGWLQSAAFGLGLSHTSKVPQVEIARSGASQRTFVYWMVETEFDVAPAGHTVFFRLHHRSDGYGLFEVDSGSTALVAGWRRSF